MSIDERYMNAEQRLALRTVNVIEKNVSRMRFALYASELISKGELF